MIRILRRVQLFDRRLRRLFACGLLAVGCAAALGGSAAAQASSMETAPAGDAVRLAMEAFGTVVEIEVRDLPEDRTRQAIRDAMVELHRLSLLTSADAEVAGGAGRIEAAAGREIEADPAYGELLLSGLRYCIWSGGAHGPLGGRLYGLWGGAERPDPYTLREALPTAACDRLEILSREPMRVRLAPQTILDTRGMERGFAADLAVEVLQEHSVANAVVEVGSVVRALGPGPDGRGWPITVPGASGSREILDEIYLHDQSLAVLSVPPGADERRPIDQRKGVPSRGVIQVAAVSELAMDAEALTYTLFVMGFSSGHRQLGKLSPRPSVHWLLGSSDGQPLESTYLWSELDRRRKRGVR